MRTVLAIPTAMVAPPSAQRPHRVRGTAVQRGRAVTSAGEELGQKLGHSVE